MGKKKILFLILLPSLFFFTGTLLAANTMSNDMPTPTVTPLPVATPPAVQPTSPPPSSPEPEEPRIKVTVPEIPDIYEKTPYTPTGVTVIVRVFESGTNKAISGATVKWYGVNYTTGATSDQRGEARLKWVPLGEAKIRCSAAGHEYNSKIVWVESGSKVQYFDIYLNKTAKNVPAAEMPVTTVTPTGKKPQAEGKASISGIVYDKVTRKPIRQAAVKAFNAGYRQDLIKDVKTDQNGRYTVDNCPLDAAIRISYGKTGYVQQDITRYIPKTATVYTQDIYLDKGKVEAKKPKKEKAKDKNKKKPESTEMVKKSLPSRRTDLAVTDFTIDGRPMDWDPSMEIGDGNHILQVKIKNNGPDEASGPARLEYLLDGASFASQDVVIGPRGEEIAVPQTTKTFEVGTYLLTAFVTPVPDDIDDTFDNNFKEGTVSLYTPPPVTPPPPLSEIRRVGLEITRFMVNTYDVNRNPRVEINPPVPKFFVTVRNNGPEELSGESKPKLTLFKDGASFHQQAFDMGPIGSSVEIPPIEQSFEEGTYTISAFVEVIPPDYAISREGSADFGRVTFVTAPPPPPPIPPGEPMSQTDLEMARFTVNDQPVNNNPTIQLVGNDPINILAVVKNNGSAESRGTSHIEILKDGQFFGSTDQRVAGINVESPFPMTVLFQPGVYELRATINPNSADDIDN
ncbi:MAG: hypothetical protein PHI59_09300, partial [Candidatus Omnitrophica bacterium]|nr:hypothetical protein [Candidatus Omnitrophota bacterium]